ncbi:MAG: hypothetical protein LH473_04555 [Chitinophagales bacterium]|nr:hypothetical protein [Chitinophagales bacterium]
MKKIFILIFILQCPLLSSSQNFAPIGATWWYSYETFGASGFIRIESIKDTLVENHNCRLLKKDRLIYNFVNYLFDSTFLGNELVYEENKVIYIQRYDSFYTLYDFNAVNNDSWTVVGNPNLTTLCDSFSNIEVETSSITDINGFELKTLSFNIDNSGEWKYTSQAIERIGSLAYLFPEPYCINDIHEGGPLRCYSDIEIGIYSTDIAPSCDFIVGNIDIVESPIVKIFYNQYNNSFFIFIGTLNINKNSSLIFNLNQISGVSLEKYALYPGWNQIKVRRNFLGLCLGTIQNNNKILFSNSFFITGLNQQK